MKNLPDIKIGVVVGSTDWMPLGIAIENRRILVETYKRKYAKEGIYECPICITDNEISIKRAMRELTKEKCTAVCFYYANYGPESAGTLFAKEFDGPAMFIAAAEEGEEPYNKDRKDALSGFINACYALKLRKTNVYIPNRPIGTFEQCVEMIHEFTSVARTLIAIRNLKVISFGPRPSSYLASNAPNQLLYDIGIEISEHSELELYNAYMKHNSDGRIKNTVESMREELDYIKTPEILPALAQYELTVDDWIRNHKGNRKYVTLTSTCWPAFPVSFGFVPCYVNSRITGKGYPVACEADVYGAVSEYIGQCVSNDVVTILNINNNIPNDVYREKIKSRDFYGKKYTKSDLFLAYHCGVTSSCKLISKTLEYHFVNHQLIGEERSKGTIQGRLVPGPITIFRLQGMRDNRLRAYVAQGQILDVSMDTYGGHGIVAIPEMERFIRYVVLEKQFPNHCTVIFGHYGRELTAILQQLGIEEIDYNHPAYIPYLNESVFDTKVDWC